MREEPGSSIRTKRAFLLGPTVLFCDKPTTAEKENRLTMTARKIRFSMGKFSEDGEILRRQGGPFKRSGLARKSMEAGISQGGM
jgi:hypothetical protein